MGHKVALLQDFVSPIGECTGQQQRTETIQRGAKDRKGVALALVHRTPALAYKLGELSTTFTYVHGDDKSIHFYQSS